MSKFQLGDVVVSQEAGLKKFVYDWEELPFCGEKRRILPAKEIINLPPGQEDWESISKSAEPKYVSGIQGEGDQEWITVSGCLGVYGGPPSHWKRVPEGIRTWCSRNEYNDPD